MTKRKTTTPTSDPVCTLAADTCGGEVWQCEFCERHFCTDAHTVTTDLGTNRECRDCERDRKDDALLQEERDSVDRLGNRLDVLDKLDIPDK